MSHKAAEQLDYLFHRQKGKCSICREPVAREDACRFRTGGGRYGEYGTKRYKVMAHKECAARESARIQAAIPLEELQARAKRWPEETYSIPSTRAG